MKIEIEKSADLGMLFFNNPVQMIGQDAAYSIPINEQETLWIFGDTLVGDLEESGRRNIKSMPSNTGLINRSKNARAGLEDYSYITNADNSLRELIPLSADESPSQFRVWAMDGCIIDSRVYLFYIKVELFPEKEWPYKFEVVGSGLAVARYPELQFERVSTPFWNKDEPCFGVAVLPDLATGKVYIYGSQLHGKKHLCYLARVDFEDISDITKYEYLLSTKPEWSYERSKMISILDGMPTEMSVSFNNYLNRHLAIYSREDTCDIEAHTAETPWGPWSEPSVLYTAKVGLRNPLVYGGPIVYAGKEHPELALQNGKTIYVTYVEFEEYFPHLVELTLK